MLARKTTLFQNIPHNHTKRGAPGGPQGPPWGAPFRILAHIQKGAPWGAPGAPLGTPFWHIFGALEKSIERTRSERAQNFSVQ